MDKVFRFENVRTIQTVLGRFKDALFFWTDGDRVAEGFQTLESIFNIKVRSCSMDRYLVNTGERVGPVEAYELLVLLAMVQKFVMFPRAVAVEFDDLTWVIWMLGSPLIKQARETSKRERDAVRNRFFAFARTSERGDLMPLLELCCGSALWLLKEYV